MVVTMVGRVKGNELGNFERFKSPWNSKRVFSESVIRSEALNLLGWDGLIGARNEPIPGLQPDFNTGMGHSGVTMHPFFSEPPWQVGRQRGPHKVAASSRCPIRNKYIVDEKKDSFGE